MSKGRGVGGPLGRVALLRTLVWVGSLAPLAWLGLRFLDDGLGANPIEALTLWSGRTTIVLLLVTLAVTPVRRVFGLNELTRFRRTLGLFAFFYATLHLLVYVVLDQFFGWSFIVEDVLERPYITAGASALLLLIPLALTSTRGWIRRLGKNWRRIHRLVYPAAALAVLHFYWKVKADTFWPLIAALVLAGLLGVRVAWWWSAARAARGRREARRESPTTA